MNITNQTNSAYKYMNWVQILTIPHPFNNFQITKKKKAITYPLQALMLPFCPFWILPFLWQFSWLEA